MSSVEVITATTPDLSPLLLYKVRQHRLIPAPLTLYHPPLSPLIKVEL